MPPRLPDFSHEAKQRLIALCENGEPISMAEAAAAIFASDRVPDSLAPALIEVIVRGDGRFERDEAGFLHYRRPDAANPLAAVEFVVLDVETTGGKPPADRITELGAVRVRGGAIEGEFCTLVNPEREIPYDVTRITGITNEMVADKPTALEILPGFADWLGDAVVVAHNAAFDRRFLDSHWTEVFGEPTANLWLCSVRMARKLYPQLRSRSLGPLCAALGIETVGLHRAGNDARATAAVLIRELDDLAARGVSDFDGLSAFVRPTAPRRPRKSPKLTYEPDGDA